VLRHLEKDLGVTPEKARVIVQGFGNVGYHCARMLHADGYRIVGLSDSQTALYAPDGMDPLAVREHKKRTGSLRGAPANCHVQELSNKALLEQACDILVPAAMENQIDAQNAPNIQARVVLEMANGPVTPGGDQVLNHNGVIVIPDILANAGGVTVSYFEWVQNKAGYYWTLPDVHARLQQIMEPEARRVWDIKLEKEIDMRTAAYVHALDRIAAAVTAHGGKAYFSS
jgi:glutamate dehydrogenase (NADP+)